jgi:hypothetical protein
MSDSIFLTNGYGIIIGLVDESYAGELIIPEYVAGERITALGYDAFRACNGITSVTIPGSIATISDSAFYECANLTTVIISNGTTKID